MRRNNLADAVAKQATMTVDSSFTKGTSPVTLRIDRALSSSPTGEFLKDYWFMKDTNEENGAHPGFQIVLLASMHRIAPITLKRY